MAYHSNGSGQQQQQQQQGQGGGGSLRGGGGGGVGLSSGNRSGGPGSIGADYSGDERDSRSGIGGGGGSGLDDRTIEHDLGDKPIYVLEHLATFTVNKESGIVYPADGMRRLLHLEKTTGIWSQKMQLCLDRQWILIMDYETGNIIERFPASMIQDPTPFTSNGPMEMYNNILVFIVAGGSGSRSEMHIFQCQSISAVHLAEDLKQLRNGKILTQHREIIQHQQQQHQQQQSPSHQQQQQQMKSFHQQHQQHQQQQQQNETDSEIGGINDETSSTSSEKYERDVTVLNHCFDDIEKFIARLQHAAAASRELERRRRNRKSKKKDPGEGLLTLRTKPPHEREFIDIFAKFKLSFNLLAKLKAHIHDPNAPELVHFLFTPLALIVDASHDTYYDPNLPARVINPLLTREAINLLINCVTSKETELWRSLGDAWTIPRDQWKGAGGNNAIMNVYHPVFFDGWSPDYPVIDDYNMDGGGGGGGGGNSVVMMTAGSPTTHQTPNLKRRIDPIIAMQHQQHQQQHPIQDYDYDTQMMGGGNSAGGGGGQQGIAAATAHRSPGSPGLLRDYSARSDISIDSIERNGGGGNGGGGVMTHHHIHHIQHQSGDMRNHDTNIILPMNSDQITANNPNNNTTTTTDLWLDDLQGRGAKIVQVTYPRTANNDKELTVQRGEYLEILDDSRKWWKARNNRGQIAHVPHTIVTICNNNDTTNDVFNNPLYQQQQQNYNKNINRQESGVSDRYPPSSINENNNSIGGGGNGSGSVLPPTAPADWVRNKHIAQRNSYGSLSSDDGGGGGGLDIHHVHEDYDMDTMQNQNRMIIIAGTPATANTTSIYRKHPQPPPAPQQRQSTAAIIHTRPISTSTTTTAILLTNGNNNNHNNNNNFNNAPPPPPPPPPLLTPVTPISNRSTSKNNTASRKSISSQGGGGAGGQDEMQEELKHVLTLFRDKRRTLDIIKTPEIFIQQSSSANEVEQWLKAKGFSDKVVKKLHGLNGNELFALKRPTLEDYCGAEEGKRLASQITIQRNVSGYKTARSSELQAILAKARKKTEEA